MSFDLAPALQQRHTDGLYRQRRLLSSPQQPQAVVDGQPVLNFCSNDYLGLANHPAVMEAFVTATARYGVGGGASHLVIGHSEAHHQLEQQLAAFTGRDAALIFSNGYMANLALISTLLGKQDEVFQDKLNHASLLDAGQISGAKFGRYLHGDAVSLQKRLEKSTAARKLIVTDGVFSMDGDIAPLPHLVDLAQQHNAWLMVDDAHGFGVLGAHGGGVAEQFNLSQQQLPVLMGTLGKAFGTYGAFVAGSYELIETLIQFARPYIYTTSIPPAIAAATTAALTIVQKEPWRREHLQHLISRFRDGCEQLGFELMPSTTPIQPILVGEANAAVALSDGLLQRGVLVSAIRPPTVPKGASRLRVTFSAQHTVEQVDALLNALKEVKDNP